MTGAQPRPPNHIQQLLIATLTWGRRPEGYGQGCCRGRAGVKQKNGGGGSHREGETVVEEGRGTG